MRNPTHKLAASLFALVVLFFGVSASADETAPENLVEYVNGAMLRWSPLKTHKEASEEVLIQHYKGIASDIVEVVSDPNEAPLFPGDKSRAKTALLLASVALHEGRFLAHVDDGRCNDRKWRKAHHSVLAAGDCDGGHAYSLWQIHPRTGIALTDEGGYKYASSGWRGKDLVTDRKKAARVALRMLRLALQQSRGENLCSYVGESGACPKAKSRLDVALSYANTHPFLR